MGPLSSLVVTPYRFPIVTISLSLDNEIHTKTTFLPARRYASAGNSDRNVSVRPPVCLSVRLSRAGIVSKRRKLAA